MNTIRVGLVGSQFVSSIHHEALRSVPYTEVVAVTSATEAQYPPLEMWPFVATADWSTYVAGGPA